MRRQYKTMETEKSKLINCTTTTTGQTGISMSTDTDGGGGGTNDNYWKLGVNE